MIQLPGVQASPPEDDDSDEDAVAARKLEKEQAAARQAAEEERAAEAEEAQRRHAEAQRDLRQVFQALSDGRQDTVVSRVIADAQQDCQEGFEERLRAAGELREEAKALFASSDVEGALRCWLRAVYCIDLTPREQSERTKEERAQLRDLLAPLLSNVSLGMRLLGDPGRATVAANIGLDVVARMPYEESKAIRVKLRLRRALAKGEMRDFAGARDDARHALQLCPGHEEATRIAFNSEAALRREGGSAERRWKGSLTAPVPKRAPKRTESSAWLPWPALLILLLAIAAALAWRWKSGEGSSALRS